MNRIDNYYPERRFHRINENSGTKIYRYRSSLASRGGVEIPQIGNPEKTVLYQIAAALGQNFLHECGHAFAATLLYQDANPEISVSVFGGYCSYLDTKPRVLGQWFGPSHSRTLVCSAGPIAEVISMLAVTKLTHGDAHPARVMAPRALGLSLYALSALFNQCSPSHDFCEVWSKSGKVAYGLLTACILATTALVWRNAMKPSNKQERQKTPLKFQLDFGHL